MVLHEPSGLLYLSCSTPKARQRWLSDAEPLLNKANSPTATEYIAIYDLATSNTTRVDFTNFDMSHTIAMHGMDLVPSLTDPHRLYIFLVHHRFPPSIQKVADVGPDSVIEIFEMVLGSAAIRHITTVQDSSVIVTPNDVIGSPDGKSFYFTNDCPTKTGGHGVSLTTIFKRTLSLYC